MPKRGPKPKQPRKSVAKSKVPAPPVHLSQEAKTAFRLMAGKLNARGVLGMTDPDLIELYAVNYTLLKQAHQEVTKDGPSIMNRWDTIIPHPMLITINQTTVRLKAILSEMGLTPASARLTSLKADEKSDDPWEGLLNVVG